MRKPCSHLRNASLIAGRPTTNHCDSRAPDSCAAVALGLLLPNTSVVATPSSAAGYTATGTSCPLAAASPTRQVSGSAPLDSITSVVGDHGRGGRRSSSASAIDFWRANSLELASTNNCHQLPVVATASITVNNDPRELTYVGIEWQARAAGGVRPRCASSPAPVLRGWAVVAGRFAERKPGKQRKGGGSEEGDRQQGQEWTIGSVGQRRCCRGCAREGRFCWRGRGLPKGVGPQICSPPVDGGSHQ